MLLKTIEEPKVEDNKELLDTGITPITSLIKKANMIQAGCHDFNVSKVTLNNVIYSNGELTFLDDSTTDIERYPLSRYALSQLGSKIGVPANYLQKCIDTGRIDLASDNVNSWIDDYNKDLFIREYNGHIRGILSSKYSVCDTPDILDVLQNTVDLDTYKVKGSFLNEERLHLRLVSKEMLPIDGEDLFSGLFIDSSDVGRNVLTVQFGIYKLICTNGLVISKCGGTLFQQKHVGIKSEDFYEGLVAALKNVDKLCESAVEMVELSRSRSVNFDVNTMSQEDFEAFIAQIKGTTKLSNDGAEKVIDLMRNKYGDSRWGYINSLTEVAQDYTLERRLEIEKIAGNLLAA